jgi:hypothetical protein
MISVGASLLFSQGDKFIAHVLSKRNDEVSCVNRFAKRSGKRTLSFSLVGMWLSRSLRIS